MSNVETNDYLYGGKELQQRFGVNLYDSGARFQSNTGAFTSPDPLAEKYYSISPYAYCAGNPVNLVDPEGTYWFYYSDDGQEPSWHWHDELYYHTGVYDSDHNEIMLMGVDAVVSFYGSRDEQLGTNANGEYGFIDGHGATIANVTVYGPNGPDDIHHFRGYTMTSNPNAYGPIDEGTYNANYTKNGKSGPLESHWILENGGRIRVLDGKENPNCPKQKLENGEGYKDGIYIHRMNKNGFAGGRISTGYLLIHYADWDAFNESLSGVNNFKVQVFRWNRYCLNGFVEGWGVGSFFKLKKD